MKFWELLKNAKDGDRFIINNSNAHVWEGVVVRVKKQRESTAILFVVPPRGMSNSVDKTVPLCGIVTESDWVKIRTVDDFAGFLHAKISNASFTSHERIKSWIEEYFGGKIKRLDVETEDEGRPENRF